LNVRGYPTKKELAEMMDHTLLDPSSTYGELEKLCEEAIRYGFGAVCINPVHVRLASQLLRDRGVKVCTVIGFPFGATPKRVKAFETSLAVADGADEVDMVMNVGALRSRDYDCVKDDIEAVVRAAKAAVVKVIIETGYLTDKEKVKACLIAKEARAQFVKTATGYGPSGASVHDVRLMRKTVGGQMGVKAAGGIRHFNQVCRLVMAGANRLGTSRSVAILKEFSSTS
jgi:deoxyribose-phosphate aldolase